MLRGLKDDALKSSRPGPVRQSCDRTPWFPESTGLPDDRRRRRLRDGSSGNDRAQESNTVRLPEARWESGTYAGVPIDPQQS